MKQGEPIAIVGIGCRFPGGVDSPETFWKLLLDGGTAIREVPKDRFDLDAFYDPRPATPGRTSARHGGFLDGLDLFDASFFEISPREAERLDPQQRLLLETAVEALDDAGAPLEPLSGSPTGVFIGMWINDFEGRLFADPQGADFYMTTGSGRYAASGRLSYAFGFQGPSLTVDTACSSSLTAVHLACQSLQVLESDLALAGAANTILQPHISVAYSQSGMLAADGRCKFGDARADGYVRSEGAAVLVLKRLSDALGNGDRIHAVIRGSAVNNDGITSGFMTTPGQGGQEEMLRRAYRAAEVDPAAVQYVEAHGTGTIAGDPVELSALGAVLGQGRDSARPLAVGSVKTNIGHTEGAAGLAGLIKVALALEHRLIPASLHFETPSPAIAWDRLPLYIPTSNEPWPATEGPPTAGVSSFGISGTNAHVVLEAAPAVDRAAVVAHHPDSPVLFPVSAASDTARREAARRHAERLLSSDPDELWDLAYTASRRRTQRASRLAAVGTTAKEIADKLSAFAAGESRAGLVSGVPAAAKRIVFVFPGQGAQWLGMGRELMQREPAFREALVELDAAIRAEARFSVLAELEAEPDHSRLGEIDIVQPVLFAIEVALAALYRAKAVEPAAVVGHSMGEAAAALVAGALSVGDAARVICHRSALLRRTSGKGAMALVALSASETARAIAGFEDRVSIAVSNAQQSTVISGEPEAVDAILNGLEEKEIFGKRVRVDVASHSPQMDPLLDDLRAALRSIQPRPAAIPMWSTVEARPVSGDELDADYWARNMRRSVLFAQTAKGLHDAGHGIFVEMSPHPTLVQPLASDLGGKGAMALGTLRREEPEQAAFLESLGALYVAGAWSAWEKVYPAGRPVPLPANPWQRERFWMEGATPAAAPAGSVREVFTTIWQEQGPTTGAPQAGLRVVVFGDASGFTESFERALGALGAGVLVIPATNRALGSKETARELLSRVVDKDGTTHIIHAAALDDSPDWEASLARGPLGLLHLVQALAEGGLDARVRLWVLARYPGQSLLGAASAMNDGLARTAGAEHPHLRVRTVFLDPSVSTADALALARSVAVDDDDNQLRFTNGVRQVKRLVRRVVPLADGTPLAGREGTFLVTGGLGGVGLLTARHLVEKEGVRSLVLVGRRPPGEAAASEIARLEQAGARVRTFRADVSDRAAVAGVLAQIDAEGPPLTGIIHAAAALASTALTEVTDAAFREVAAGKARGAWNLHELTLGRPLVSFVLYSSVVPLLGLTAHGSYAAPNSYLDALAIHRRACGLPATSIAWGPWRGIGMAVAGDDRLAAFGLPGLVPQAGLDLLARILRLDLPYAAAVEADWERFAEAFPGTAAWPVFSDVVRRSPTAPAAAPAGGMKEQAEAIEFGSARLGFLEDRVCDTVAAVVRRRPSQIDREKSFRALGFDSLMGLELRNRLASTFGVAFPATLIWNFPTVRSLTPELARRAEIALRAEAPVAQPGGRDDAELERMLAELEGMSDDEARKRAAAVPE